MDHDHYPYTDAPQHVNHEERLALHKNHSKLLIPIILLIVGVLVVGGLSFAYTRVGKQQCTYKGITYDIGDSVPSEDGCNSCSCTYDEQSKTAQVACTLMACEEDIYNPTGDLTSDWEIYVNQEYGFEFKYPTNLFWKPIEGITFFDKNEVSDIPESLLDPYTQGKIIVEIHTNQTLQSAVESYGSPSVGFNPSVEYKSMNGYQTAQIQNSTILEYNNMTVWFRCNLETNELCTQILSTFRFLDEENNDL